MDAKRYIIGLLLLSTCLWQAVFAQAGAEAFKDKRYLQAAQQFYQQKQAGSGKTNVVQYYLGMSYLEMGKICQEAFALSAKRGADYLGQIIRHNPAMGEAYYFQGLNLLAAGQKSEAGSAMTKASQKASGEYNRYAAIWQKTLSAGSASTGAQPEQLVANAFLFKGNSAASPGRQLSTAQDSVNAIITMIVGGHHEDLNRQLFIINPSLKAFSKRVPGSQNTSVTFSFFHPLALHFLADHFYRSAILEFNALRTMVTGDREKTAVDQALAEAYAAVAPASASDFFASNNDPLVQVYHGLYLWKQNQRSQAQQIWQQLVGGKDSRAAGKAGYFMAAHARSVKDGLKALARADKQRKQQLRGRSDQEIATLLSKTYVLDNQPGKAMATLDNARAYRDANDPVFQLNYAETAYIQGKNRFNDVLLALSDVESRFRMAKQVHYLYQGLIAERIRSEGEVVR